MLARVFASTAIAFHVVAAPLACQSPGPAAHQMTLVQALDLAKRNSPAYRQAATVADPAAEAAKQASWARLPTVSLQSGMGYTGAGSQTFGGQVFASSPTLQSNYGIGVGLQLSTRVFLTPAILRAQEHSALESIAAAGVSLTSTVTTAYLNGLLATATVDVALEQVAADTGFLRLARARQSVGQASILDVLQAQTTLANAQVQLLQAQQSAVQSKIALVQVIGLPADNNVDALTLAEPFLLVEPAFDLSALRAMAKTTNPSIQSLEESDRANGLSVRAARLDPIADTFAECRIERLHPAVHQHQHPAGQPTRQRPVVRGELHPAEPDPAGFDDAHPGGGHSRLLRQRRARSHRQDPAAERHATHPDQQQCVPVQLHEESAVVEPQHVSVPLWDAYSRSLPHLPGGGGAGRGHGTVARAAARNRCADSDAAGCRAHVLGALIGIQDTNRTTARQQLNVATQRYTIGSGTALDVATAQIAVTQAEAAYVTAVFNYHLAVVALEAAVGRPLR